MINWIAVKEANFEEMRQKWESLPKELRYAAYGGAGGSALAMLIHRLMGTDHRKGRTIGWGAIGALTGGAGGAVTGYTERKIAPYIRRLANAINDSAEGYRDNIRQAENTQKQLVQTVEDRTQEALDKVGKVTDEGSNVLKGLGRVTNAMGDAAEFTAEQIKGKIRWLNKQGKKLFPQGE